MIQSQREELPADAMPGESVVALYFSDQKPLDGAAALLDWRLDGQLTRMLLDRGITGRAGEHVMLQSNGKLKAGWALFVGGGKWHGLCRETHASLVRHMLSVASQAGFRDISLAFSPHEEVDIDTLHQQVDAALKDVGTDIVSCRFTCRPLTAV